MENISVIQAGRVATVVLNRPEKMNAMSWPMLTELREALAALDADNSVRAIVLTGEGRAFCAGTDMADLQTMGANTARPVDRRGFTEYNPQATSPWEVSHVGKPVIAAINGAAVGLGIELATQCDVRIASSAARLGWVFTRRGIIPDTGAGTYLLPHIVGLSTALKWTISGELVFTQEALAAGFVDEICEPDQLRDRAIAIAEGLAGSAPMAVKEAKRLMYASFGRGAVEHVQDTSSTLRQLFQTADHREGIASFLERRPADFKGA